MFHNGGAPSGMVSDIRWTRWGADRSHGWGKIAVYKPSGGYYSKRVRIELRALDLGHCRPGSRLAYKSLRYRMPNRPGGPVGTWRYWSSYNGRHIC